MPQEKVGRHIIITLFWAAIVFAILLYQFPADRRLTLFFVNKTVAQTAVVLIGTSYLLGPLCKILPFLSQHVRYRKYFGLGGFTVILVHIGTSLFQFSDRFPFAWYLDHAVGITAATAATIIFFVLAATSRKEMIEKLGGQTWKTIQRLGYVALFLVLIHVYAVAMGRWQQWFAGTIDMPTSFLVFIFGILVIIVRIASLIADKRKPRGTSPSSQ